MRLFTKKELFMDINKQAYTYCFDSDIEKRRAAQKTLTDVYLDNYFNKEQLEIITENPAL